SLSASSFHLSHRSGVHPDLHSFLHDALPIYFREYPLCQLGINCLIPWALARGLLRSKSDTLRCRARLLHPQGGVDWVSKLIGTRSEEHTSELQSRENLVCRLLLEKKNKKKNT